MPWYEVRETTYFDSYWVRDAALGTAVAMVLAGAYQDGEFSFPDWSDEWGLSEWAAVPTVIGIVLSLFRLRMKSVSIRKLNDDN